MSAASPAELRTQIVERLVGATGEPDHMKGAARQLVERALQAIAAGLQERLALNLTIELKSVEVVRIGAVRPIGEGCAMAIVASASSGDALNLSMDAQAVAVIVGAVFGGDPDMPAAPIARALSPTEAEVATAVFEEIAKAVNGSGARSLEIKLPIATALTGAELRKRLLRDGPGVRVELAVSTPASSGRIWLAMPQRVLLKHRGATATPKDGGAAAVWRQHFSDEVMRSNVDLRATMPLGRMTLGQVAAMHVGQVIELEEDAQSQARLSARQKTLFVCEFGKLGQNYTVRIRPPHYRPWVFSAVHRSHGLQWKLERRCLPSSASVRYYPHNEMGKIVGKRMARSRHKLSDVSVKAAKKPGRHADGGGLYLNVSKSGTKSWLFMWVRGVNQTGGAKRTEMGLGSYPTISLASARQKADAYRASVAAGGDPKAERDKEAEPTFGDCVSQFLASMEPSWRSARHRAQWKMTLTEYCPLMLPKRVSLVGTDDVLRALNPIWQAKSATASRLRGRIERVLDFAKAKGWRSGENPALWRGHLKSILPARKKLTRGHHAAMPYADVPAFMARLDRDAMSARVLELLILTVCRSGEVLGARWPEFDLDKAVWTIPPERMKLAKEHRVPLAPRAVAMLCQLHETRQNDWVFPGQRPGRPLSKMVLEMLMTRMGVSHYTPHGFRSAFRDWAGDETTFQREVAEAALAHKVGDETERAYRRSDALEKRRKLMQAWADYLAVPKANNVVALGKK